MEKFNKIGERVRWGYITAFILLLGSYILSYTTTQKLLEQAALVNHTNAVINKLNVLQSSVKDGESSFRGYLIVKDENFLNTYKSTIPVINNTFSELRKLVNDNSSQLKNLDELRFLIKEKYTLITTGLTTFRAHNYQITDSIKVLGYKGKQNMDNIRTLMSRMQDQENDLMISRSLRLSTFSDFINILNIASLVISFVLIFYSITAFSKENKAKKQADYNAKAFREQLELRVKELAELNKELIELRSMEKFAVTGRISRAIAHEVRNPLTNINLAAEHLRGEITPTTETNMLLEMITRNGTRINQLISDLLNTTKVTQINLEKLSLNELLDESLQFALDRVELKGIKVIKNYTKNLCDISGDADKLKIAFLNIFVNAIEAMEPDKGILTIKTDSKNSRCIAMISDNGKGISKEHISKLFEPYFTTKETGTGLGLAHVQNIILSHKASISADSEVGKGTTFTVELNYA